MLSPVGMVSQRRFTLTREGLVLSPVEGRSAGSSMRRSPVDFRERRGEQRCRAEARRYEKQHPPKGDRDKGCRVSSV
jgi:hypothetical protein